MTTTTVGNGASAHASAAGPSPAVRDPVLAALERIEQRIASLERDMAQLTPLATVLATAPGGVAMITDTLDNVAAALQSDGVDIDARVRSTLRIARAATSQRSVDALVGLLESRLLDPAALDIVGRLAVALAEPGEIKPTGTWGMLRALRDPDVQRAVGFLLAVARVFGRELAESDAGQLVAKPTYALEAP